MFAKKKVPPTTALFRPEVVGKDYYGCLGIGKLETDYQLSGGILDLSPARNSFWKFQYQYAQNDVAPMTCTIVSSAAAISDLTGQEWSIPQLQQIVQDALKLGFSESIGWYVNSAVDLVSKEVSKKGVPIGYYVLQLDSNEFYDALDKGYSVVTSFSGNASYNADENDNDVINSTTFGSPTFGHCIRMVKNQTDNTVVDVVDNYPKTAKYNIYEIPKVNFQPLIKNNVFAAYGYVFAYQTDIILADSTIWAKVSPFAKLSAQKMVLKNYQLDWSQPQKIVGTDVLEQIFINMGAFQKKQGNVTLERLAVALDFLKLL